MKPLITRRFPYGMAWWPEARWKCGIPDSTVYGQGDTPEQAYASWVRVGGGPLRAGQAVALTDGRLPRHLVESIERANRPWWKFWSKS